MKYYKNSKNVVIALKADGSEDSFKKPDHVEITKAEADALISTRLQAEFDAQDYYRKRINSYPEMGEFVDAWVKNDQAALEEYRQKCLAVKAQFPKPPGF